MEQELVRLEPVGKSRTFNVKGRLQTFTLLPYQLELGKEYIVWWGGNKRRQMRVKFIQVTRMGYNFVNLETNKCILKQHLYQSKKEEYFNQMVFFVNHWLNIHRVKIKFNKEDFTQ